MSKQQLNVCVVGCGALGTVHAEAWQRLPNAKVVAVVDIIEVRAKILAEKCGLDAWYLDYRDVPLEGVDVVSVCVPTCSHSEISVYAAEHGKHVISEKPIALTLEGAEAMIRAAEENGVKLALGFMRRHSPILPAMRAWLSAGQLGRPVLYQATDFREIRPKIEMHDANANGGPVIDMGVHLFDLWAYIFDAEPVEVSARGLTFAEGRDELASVSEIACETATITVTFASGDIGVFNVCWGLPPTVTPPPARDQILGANGFAEAFYARDHQEIRALYEVTGSVFDKDKEDEETSDEPPLEDRWQIVASSRQDMYRREIANFAHCIQNDLTPLAGGAEGLRALRVALGAMESIRTGKTVKLQSE